MINLSKTSLALVILVLAAFLPGCGIQKDEVLSEDAHKWIPYTAGHPAVTLTNDLGQVRTLDITYTAVKKEITPKFSFSSYFQDQVNATLTDQDGVGVGVSLTAAHGEQEFGITSGKLLATHLVGTSVLNHRGMNDAFLTTYTSRGKSYQQVIHLKCFGDKCKGDIQ